MESVPEKACRADINFDSDIEVKTLKDALWKLTTRVYLLEDFISVKFGEVLGNSGYSNSTQQVSGDQSKRVNDIIQSKDAPAGTPKFRKRKRTTAQKRTGNKLQKPSTLENEETPCDSHEAEAEDNGSKFSANQNAFKEEIIDDGSNDGDASIDIFLPFQENESGNSSFRKSDADNDGGDSDYIPDIISDNQSDEERRTVKKTSKNKSPKEKDLPNVVGGEETHNRQSNNIDSKIEFVPSNVGSLKLAFEGFLYCKHRSVNQISYWRCEKRGKCPGRAVYSEGGGLTISTQHNHPAEPERQEVAVIKKKMVDAAMSSSEMPSRVFQQCMEGASVEAAGSISEENAKRRLRYHRKRQQKSSEDFQPISDTN